MNKQHYYFDMSDETYNYILKKGILKESKKEKTILGTVPVYGNTPIFTCPNNNGCGCGFNTTSQFI